jgi:putative heme transporter
MRHGLRLSTDGAGAPGWPLRALTWCLFVLAAAATFWLVAIVLRTLIVVTTAIIAALLLTALLHPVVTRLVKVGTPRWLAALLSLVLTLAGLGGFGYLLVGRIAAQADDLRGALRQSGERLRSLALDSPLPVTADDLDRVPTQTLEALQQAAPAPLTGANIAVSIVTALALTLFLWFFLMKDGPHMWRWFVAWLPRRRRPAWEQGGSVAWHVLGAYVRGTIVIAFADAVGAGITMAILGVPLTMSLSVLIFLGAFVPIVGSTVAGTVAVVVTLATVGPVQALILLGAVIAVQQLEGNLLQPLVMGRALDFHPAAIVLSVTAGTLVAGVLGALVAVPVVAIAYRVTDDLVRGRDVPSETAPEAEPEAEPEAQPEEAPEEDAVSPART